MSRADAVDDTFGLAVEDVFTLTGRGTVVIGPLLDGVLRTGEPVEVRRDDVTTATATAVVELVCTRDADPRTVAILLRGLTGERPRAGDVVRKPRGA